MKPHHRLGIVVGLTMALAGCGSEGTPVPLEPPFGGFASGLHFDMFGADLLERRPAAYPTEEGTFEESDGLDDRAFHMRPWEEGELPDLMTRLVGVEHRTEYSDSLQMWAEWLRRVERYTAATGTSPSCATLRTMRFAATRAIFEGPIEWRLVASVIQGADGQSYDAFLNARVSQGELDGLVGRGEAGVWTEDECPRWRGVAR